MTELVHSVAALLEVPAAAAFDFMADPVALGGWSLGCMATEPDGPDRIHRGRSLFDGATGHFRIEADPAHWSIDYHLGPPGRMVPRIAARITPGPICGYAETASLVTLLAWRQRDMDDARWHRLCASHEVEILLIKSQCEAGWSVASREAVTSAR